MNKKKLTALTLAAMLAMSAQAVSVSAATMEPFNTKVEAVQHVIAPRWANTTKVVPSITNSGRSITVSVLIKPNESTEKSKGTLYLQKYNGRKWTTVKSWSIDEDGTVDITKSYTGKSKVKYRTKVVVTTGGDKITSTSSEITL